MEFAYEKTEEYLTHRPKVEIVRRHTLPLGDTAYYGNDEDLAALVKDQLFHLKGSWL